MQAMVFDRPGLPLRWMELERPKPAQGHVLIRVAACGVCRTDLHICDGDLAPPSSPRVLGHEIVGKIEEVGKGVQGLTPGMRVGVPWLGWTCGICEDCRSGRENLCEQAEFTGYTRDGGYAEYAVADARYAFSLPDSYSDEEAAPLLCAGLIGHRAYRMAGDGHRLGIYGFGAAAHILAQMAVCDGKDVYAFTRPGDREGQGFAQNLGAIWAGGSDAPPPVPLDAAILFAPVGSVVPLALQAVRPGGVVVCAGIYMSDLPSFPYRFLWGERVLKSVANLTRQDGLDFFQAIREMRIQTSVQVYPLLRANQALEDLRAGRVQGAAVLNMSDLLQRSSDL